MKSKLIGRTISTEALTPAQAQAMFSLFNEYFEVKDLRTFYRDLKRKQWVILLVEEGTDLIQGFSTMAAYVTCFEGRRISIIYSGDTIIRPAFWGTSVLPKTWIDTVLKVSRDLPTPLYWLLLSSGYKTYRFLPLFFKEFYPRYDRDVLPETQALIDHVATELFGSEYCRKTGVVQFERGATPLRAGVAEVDESRRRNPHVAFFLDRNPGHVRGDELVCLAEIHPDNITPAGMRMVQWTIPQHA